MSEHYFSPRPSAPHAPRRIAARVAGLTFHLLTDRGVFSYEHVDPGSRLLGEAFVPDPEGRVVVDLGAGYGAIGIAIALRFRHLDVTMVEINARAAALCRQNAAANGVAPLVVVGDGLRSFANRTVDAVVTNPPIRAGRHVFLEWVAQARCVLRPGGSFWFVMRTRQGAESAAAIVLDRLGHAEVVERGGGFRVVRARLATPFREDA